MVLTIKRRGLLQAAGIAATTYGAGMAFPGIRMAHAADAPKFKIALSNSYIGNKWRLEMERASMHINLRALAAKARALIKSDRGN